MADTRARPPLVSPDAATLLSLLRADGPQTRAQLAERSGLARSTVALRLEALIASGLVVHAGGGASSGGRPPSVLAFNRSARLAIGVDLGATHGLVALVDLGGTVLDTAAKDLAIGDGPVPVLDWVVDTTRRLLKGAKRPISDVVGIGIGVPGPVEHTTGRPTNPPIMPGWDRFDVPGYVQRSIDVPVLVDNDVNVLALGERAVAWPGEDDLFFVKVSTGIGAGIISGGRLQRGAKGSAGDLGHVLVPSSDGADLEAMASARAVARRLTEQGIPAETSSDVLALASRGDPVVLAAIRQAGRDIGEAVASCVNLLNPSVVVVGGSMARTGEYLLAGVREVVYGRSTPLATQELTITSSRGGVAGGALGAATLVIQNALEPEEK
jgi:predicted NBD/HSP70 family sugar kinase